LISWWYDLAKEDQQGFEKRNREKKDKLKRKFNLYLSFVEKVASMLDQDYQVKNEYF